VGPRHKDVFPRCGEARHAGPEAGHGQSAGTSGGDIRAASNYWSSTSNANNPNNAWNVNFNNGNVNNDNKTNTNFVIAVRGGS